MPDAMNGQIVYSYRPKPGAEQAIYWKISDITISMKSTDHLKMQGAQFTELRVFKDHQIVISRLAEKDLPLPGVPKISPLGYLSRGTF